MFFSNLSFLHFALISIIEIPGVSSMYISASESGPIVSASFTQSSSSSFPVLTLLLSTIASLQSILFTICSFDISKLKTATGTFAFVAALVAMFNANADLPIAGLAAIRIKSEPWNPAVL